MVQYRKVAFTYCGARFGILLEPLEGSSALVAIHNCQCFEKGRVDFIEGTVDEQEVTKSIRAQLKEILDTSRLSHGGKQGVLRSVYDLSPEFRVSPLLNSHEAFEHDSAYLLFVGLKIDLMHGWLLNPELSIYESIKDFSPAKLEKYITSVEGMEDLKVIQGLIDDSRHQLTDYGVSCLAEKIDDDSFVVLFWHNRFDILFKQHDELFILVTDESTRQRMPQVTWKLFEHSQEANVYLTEDFIPVTGQPYEERAGEWHERFLEKISEAQRNASATAAAAEREAAEAHEAEKKQKKKDKKKRAKQRKAASTAEAKENASDQHTEQDEIGHEEEHQADGSQADGSARLGTVISPLEEKEAEVGSQHANSSGSQMDVVAVASVRPEADNVLAENLPEDKGQHVDQCSDSTANSPEETKGIEAVECHVSGSHDVGAVSSLQQKDVTVEIQEDNPEGLGATANSQEKGKGAVAVESSLVDNSGSPEVDVPEGVASDFLKFLNEFKDDGCSDFYFKIAAEAFKSSITRRFYVPYEFIMAFDKKLALNIQDNQSRVFDDLEKAVVRYLKDCHIDSMNVKVKITDLPKPNRVEAVSFTATSLLPSP